MSLFKSNMKVKTGDDSSSAFREEAVSDRVPSPTLSEAPTLVDQLPATLGPFSLNKSGQVYQHVSSLKKVEELVTKLNVLFLLYTTALTSGGPIVYDSDRVRRALEMQFLLFLSLDDILQDDDNERMNSQSLSNLSAIIRLRSIMHTSFFERFAGNLLEMTGLMTLLKVIDKLSTWLEERVPSGTSSPSSQVDGTTVTEAPAQAIYQSPVISRSSSSSSHVSITPSLLSVTDSFDEATIEIATAIAVPAPKARFDAFNRPRSMAALVVHASTDSSDDDDDEDNNTSPASQAPTLIDRRFAPFGLRSVPSSRQIATLNQPLTRRNAQRRRGRRGGLATSSSPFQSSAAEIDHNPVSQTSTAGTGATTSVSVYAATPGSASAFDPSSTAVNSTDPISFTTAQDLINQLSSMRDTFQRALHDVGESYVVFDEAVRCVNAAATAAGFWMVKDEMRE